jgi:flagellar capping protein FliD
MSDIGIGRDSNDKLTLSTEVLSSKLDSNLDGVRSLLSGTSGKTGLFSGISKSCDQLSDDVTGVVQNAITGYKTSIQTLAKSITDQTARINSLRDSLTRQFAVVDSAINQLNSQGTTLTSIISSLKPKD